MADRKRLAMEIIEKMFDLLNIRETGLKVKNLCGPRNVNQMPINESVAA